MTSNNEVATGQDVQRLRRRWRQKLLSQNDKVKLKGAAKRKGGNTNIVTKRIIRRLRKDMTENEVLNILLWENQLQYSMIVV